MTRFLNLCMAACLVTLAGIAVAGSGSSGCVNWTSEARTMGFAYKHLVHLDNQCEEAMVCDVWTDVNPEVQSVELEPLEQQTVTTYIGSPSREFQASVECEEAD